MAGIDYAGWLDNGSGTKSGVTKYMPFSNESQEWWMPGKSEFLFGGGATKDMPAGPASGAYQTGYLKNMLGNGAPQMNTGQSDQARGMGDQTRGQQQQLAQMLFQQANGQTQGAGELAVQRQANNAMANNTSAAQMARGANTAMAMRNAARTNADIGVNAAGQAGIAQLQDQQSAQNQLGGLLGATRGQDLQTRGQDIQTAGANQAAQMQQQQVQLAALAQMLGVDQAALQQDMEKRKIAATDKGMFPELLKAGGSLMAASDRDLKTGIYEAGREVDYILSNLKPYEYHYKDETRHGVGPRIGIMAQDLEGTALGAAIVEDTEDGKMIDLKKALSFALAAVARLDARVRELEGK